MAHQVLFQIPDPMRLQWQLKQPQAHLTSVRPHVVQSQDFLTIKLNNSHNTNPLLSEQAVTNLAIERTLRSYKQLKDRPYTVEASPSTRRVAKQPNLEARRPSDRIQPE